MIIMFVIEIVDIHFLCFAETFRTLFLEQDLHCFKNDLNILYPFVVAGVPKSSVIGYLREYLRSIGILSYISRKV